jgi:hypothetical protein
MAAPKTKAELRALANTYLDDVSPNIRASEHRELATAIADRIDARILAVGEARKASANGYWTYTHTFIAPVYTTNYLVHCVAVGHPWASWSISDKTLTGFKINVITWYGPANTKLWYVVYNRDLL